ncbi:SPOR domain-containing protein [Thiotrichales bacterium 19X7-9]|nr:SPOR domain-containing protein [Thiotrichales bacterium 19X7-9]
MVIRDYAKNTVTAQPTAKPKRFKTANKLKNTAAKELSASSNQKSTKKTATSKFQKTTKSIKRLTIQPSKKTTSKAKRKPTTKANYKKNNLKSKHSFNLTKKAKSQLTSISVFVLLGLITVILLLLLFYVMSHKKTTEIKEITLPKPASFLNPPSLNPNKPAPVVTIPINSNKNNESQLQDTNSQLNNDIQSNLPTQTTITSQQNNDTEPKFTFYDTLTKQTVQVDATPKVQQKYEYTYALQVASYKNQNDASSMRARLLLIGLKPIVAKKGSYYVVSIGNIKSKREGDVIKHKLEANNIQGSMLVQTAKKPIN